eukprot:TRINITY_DN3178_c0_g3_i4.p1 TRINITY_DN3178_c0_g3~~TRINITY_DN3178_c0_g3_i4.p1  ORF type:complete len:389 (+),score=102.39 TRINITY_DN3178_c0_g3_i4:864-2030(+)
METQAIASEKSEAQTEEKEAAREETKESPADDLPPNAEEKPEVSPDEWNPREEEAKFVSTVQSDISEQFALTSTLTKDTPDKYDLVSYLFSFIDVDSGFEFNELLAGYFKRAAMALIAGKPRDMSDLFEKNPEIMERLFTHSVNQSISDVLCKVLSVPELAIDNPAWLEQTQIDILQKLFARLENPATDPLDLTQLVSTFCNLLDQCKRFQYLCCALQAAERLFFMSLNKSSEISSAALSILTKLMLLENSGFIAYLKGEFNPPPPKDSKKGKDSKLLKLIIKQLKYFKAKLMEEYEPVVRQCGEVRPLGVYRLKIVEYVSCVVKLQTFAIIEQLDKQMYPSLLWRLFTRFPMNSVLHGVVFGIFKFIFESRCKSLIYVVVFGLKSSS